MGRIRDRDGLLHPPALGACGRFWQRLRSNGRTFGTNAQRAFSMPWHHRINGSRVAPVSLPSRTSFEQPGEDRGGGPRTNGNEFTCDAGGILPGYDVTSVAVDDRLRLAFAEVWPADRAECAASFLDHALAYYRSLGGTHRAGPDRQRQGIRFRAVRSPM